MRVTVVLLKYRPEFHGYIPKFPGKVEIGKNRYVPKITNALKLDYWRETSYEMQVMKYLSKPYITEVQEIAYLQSVQRTQPEYWDDYLNKKMMIPLRQRYAADLMAPLDRSRNIEEQD